MQRCILIGAGDCNVQKIETKPEDFVIAVDGGYDTCRKYDIVPDLIVGDFDSAQESDMPQIAEIAKIAPDHVVVLPTEKDDTDMLAAIRIGLLEGCQEFRIYGGMGGRLEHTLANLQCLIYLKQCSAVGYLMDDKTTAFVMQNETVWFKPEGKGFLSLFSLGEKASGVTIRNLKYEMQDGEMTNSFPIGISNEFIGKRSSVTVEQGMLAVILSEKNNGRKKGQNRKKAQKTALSGERNSRQRRFARGAAQQNDIVFMPRCSDLHHIFKLTHVQIVVEAFLRKQLRCIALLDDAAVVDDEDPVGLLDRGKAVCNDKGGTSL